MILQNEFFHTVFTEIVRFFKIILTLTDAERCFRKGLRSVLRRTMVNERLNALTVMTLKKSLVVQSMNQKRFVRGIYFYERSSSKFFS